MSLYTYVIVCHVASLSSKYSAQLSWVGTFWLPFRWGMSDDSLLASSHEKLLTSRISDLSICGLYSCQGATSEAPRCNPRYLSPSISVPLYFALAYHCIPGNFCMAKGSVHCLKVMIKKKMFHCSVVPLNHIGQLKGDAGSSLCRTWQLGRIAKDWLVTPPCRELLVYLCY